MSDHQAAANPQTPAIPPGLAKLRERVPEHLISPLPKPTKAQSECPREQKIRCDVCGGFHHPNVVHLAYVGHAAATHLLLEADPFWNWEPLAFTPEGLPRFDEQGGLWIRLTVCGVTRLGYGNAAPKSNSASSPGDREKEVIGDAIRNAAMRFGLALELWSKADLHRERESSDDEDQSAQDRNEAHRPAPEPYPQDKFDANLPAWRALVESGKQTGAGLLAKFQTKNTFTPEQQKQLLDLDKKD
jgi:hypothetical protein